MSNQSLFFTLSFFGLSLLWQAPVQASYIKPTEIPSFKKSFEASLQSEFFRSHANYTNLGQYVSLPESHSFQYILFKPKVSYSPFNKHAVRFSAFADTFYASSQTPRENRKLPFKLSVLGGSLDFYHKIQTLFIGLEVTGAYSFHSLLLNTDTGSLILNSPYNILPEEIVVGENASYFEPALHFIFKPSIYLHIYTRNAFRYRLNGLSSLLFSDWGVVGESENISAGLSLNTFFSLGFFDSFSNEPEKRHQALTATNAGSYKFYSVNPSVISGTLWLNFKYNFFDSKLYVNLDTLGKNYAKGLTVGLITSLRFQSSTDTFLEKKRRKNRYMDFGLKNSTTRTKVQKKNSYFDESADPYTDNFDKDESLELRKELQLLNE